MSPMITNRAQVRAHAQALSLATHTPGSTALREAAASAPLSPWLRMAALLLVAALVSLSLPLLAHAGIPNKPATIVTNIVTMLTGLGVGLFTAACMWTGYKMAFAGAQFRDVSNILWGGVLAGGAAGFAGWLFS